MKYQVPRQEAFDYYDAKIKIVGDTVELKRYSKTITRLKPGLEPIGKDTLEKPLETSRNKQPSGVLRDDNKHRAYVRLLDVVIMNKEIWKSFITLTFKENVTDLDYANKEYAKCIRKMKKDYPTFKSVTVPEFQKRGAVHYHMLTNVPCNSQIIPKQAKKRLYNASSNKWTDLEYYELKYWSHGFSSAFDIVNEVDDKFNIAKYLGKYFWKDIDDRLFGRQKIMVSKGLKRPTELILNQKTQDYTEIVSLLEENYKLQKEKDILSAKSYIPDVNIKIYSSK